MPCCACPALRFVNFGWRRYYLMPCAPMLFQTKTDISLKSRKGGIRISVLRTVSQVLHQGENRR